MAHLPDDPDLGWLRKRAKEIRREHPDWKLADAQLHLARHYGFPSWPRLKRYVELVRSYRRAPDEVPEQAQPQDEFLRLACLTYGQDDPQRQARAAGMLADEPTLGADDIWVAATRCDVDGLRRLLEDNSGLASREGGPFEWAPLAYLAYARHDPDVSEAATLASAQLLLDHGADPDTGYLWHGLPSPFTALTGCFGEGEGGPGNQPAHPHGLALARLLLEAGADANDAQTLYNRMFRPDDSHLRLLFEFGLGTGDGGPWKRRLGPAAMGPAEMLAGQLAWAVLHGMDARVELLAAHGVDLDTKLDDFGGAGETAYEAAVVSGHARTPPSCCSGWAPRPARSGTISVWSPRSWPLTGPRWSDWWRATRACSPAPGRSAAGWWPGPPPTPASTRCGSPSSWAGTSTGVPAPTYPSTRSGRPGCITPRPTATSRWCGCCSSSARTRP